MSEAHGNAQGARRLIGNAAPRWWKHQGLVLVLAIVLAAAVLRVFQLGRTSLWYDEVVTMRLARTESVAALLKLLDEIDATRAPLHPVLLQSWVALFGPSDVSGRAFSCLCGILTVALVYWVGLQAFDRATGFSACWLCALSPLLIYYSREARMYALLVLITCVGWGCLFANARSPRTWKLGLYGLCLTALGYTHPLGLLMVGALGSAALLCHQSFGISWRSWLLIHLAVAVALGVWLPHYLDHEPESVTGLLPLRFLFGMPIGFIGGNSLILILISMLIVYGLLAIERREKGGLRVVVANPTMSVSLLLWMIAAPLGLYVYSWFAHPIFGPARYTLFAGPAYLILVARGIAKLPLPLAITAAAGGAVLSGAMLPTMVFRHDLKADWRSAAAYLDRRDPGALVAVISSDRSRNVEFESARYYFRPGRVVVPCPASLGELTRMGTSVWVSIGLREGRPAGVLPAELLKDDAIREVVDFPGLRLMKVDLQPDTDHPRLQGARE
jgi:4-amino-4-deoxy-L-arabinose transferase-like glycosyltransferase